MNYHLYSLAHALVSANVSALLLTLRRTRVMRAADDLTVLHQHFKSPAHATILECDDYDHSFGGDQQIEYVGQSRTLCD